MMNILQLNWGIELNIGEFRVGFFFPGGWSLSQISATHPCTHTSKLAPKWVTLTTNFAPLNGVDHEKPTLKGVFV